MTKMTKFAPMLLAGALFFSGCAANPADNVPAAGVSSPTTATDQTPEAPQTPGENAQAAPAEGTVYGFAEGTEVGFVGSKVTGSHDGGFKKVEGSVTVPGENLEQAVVELRIDMASVYSDTDKLTEHLRTGDFFDVPNNPTSTFKSTGIAKADAGYNVTGDLTMRGVTQSITFPAEITLEGDTVKTKAEFSINRKDFNVAYAGKPDDLIRDEVVIKFDITANKQEA
ncbi:MAG: YceI family protein [Vulcanimicrobiota bacterium]